MSQEELARALGVARPTVSQMENGERKICSDELVRLARLFNVSVENLLGISQEPEIVLEGKAPVKETPAPSIRINVPRKNIRKFKEALLYILNKVGSKANIGEAVIYKLLYFMDFDYYEKYEEQFIGAAYIKNHYGPTPVEFKKVVEQMAKSKDIERIKSVYYNYPQTKYLPLRKADLSLFNATEIGLMNSVLDRLSDMNAAQIRDYSHGDVPWLTSENGKIIGYESVFYRTPAYSVREYDDDIQ